MQHGAGQREAVRGIKIYYDDAALKAYVERHSHHAPGFSRAYFELARSGAERVDLWRALVTWLEGGVYVDIDTVCRTPLYAVIRPDDDAVSGVGHREGGPEQFILAYAPRHPIIWRYLRDAVAAVHGGAEGGVVNATGPTALYRAAIQVLQLPGGHRFSAGTYRVHGRAHAPDGPRSLRILDGNYTCPPAWPYCSWLINSFGGNVKFKYDHKDYVKDLADSGVAHWGMVDKRVARGTY